MDPCFAPPSVRRQRGADWDAWTRASVSRPGQAPPPTHPPVGHHEKARFRFLAPSLEAETGTPAPRAPHTSETANP